MPKNPYEEYLEWEKSKNSRWSKVSKQIKPVHVMGFLLLIFGGNYLVSTGKVEGSFFWAIFIAFSLFFFFLMFRNTHEQKLIPEQIIKQIAQEALDKKKFLGKEIPFDFKVRVTLVGEAIWEQDMITGTSGIIKRDVGFEVRKKGLIKKGVIGIHPYNGTILGIRWEKFGYSGKGSKDRIIIPMEVIKKS